MATKKLVGDFDYFWSMAKKPLDSKDRSTAIQIGIEMKELGVSDVRLRESIIELFDGKAPTPIPTDLTQNFNTLRNKGVKPMRAAVYWYFLHSRTYDLDPAHTVDRTAFFKRSEQDSDIFEGKTFEEKFGRPVFEETEELPTPNDCDLTWVLKDLGEDPNVLVNMYDLNCKLTSDEPADQPARICFLPYLETRDFAGVRFGFRRATIRTSLNSTSTDTRITFNKLYEEGYEVNGAEIKKTGSSVRGQWMLEKGATPLSGDYPFTGEAVSIHFKGMELVFDVKFRIDGFSSSICHEDGTEVTDQNRRAYLRMLAGDKVLEEHGGKIADLLLTTRRYRLVKENPYD